MVPDGSGVAADVHEAVMEATYAALCEHGFAGLTMQAIADEAGKSTALLHYHYDTKDELLVAFLEFTLERFAEKLDGMDAGDPEARLSQLLDLLVGPSTDDWEFASAFLELWAQAPYQEPFREQLARNEAYVRDRVESVVADGVESGAFRPVDPELAARLVLDAVDGARVKRAALDDVEEPAAVRDAVEAYLLGTDETGASA